MKGLKKINKQTNNLLLLANKLIEKYLILVMLNNTITQLQERKTKSIKQSEIITYKPKIFEN